MRTIVACVSVAIVVQAAPAQLVRFRTLGDLPGGEFNGQAHDVSADGSTVVGFSDHNGWLEAYRWTPYAGLTGLGTPTGSPPSNCRSIDLSADGAVVIGTIEPGAGGTLFFRWTSAGGITQLTLLPNTSRVVDLSGDGQSVLSYGLQYSAINTTLLEGL